MWIKGNFGGLDDLARHIQATVTGIQDDLNEWKRTSVEVNENWRDVAGGAFVEVSDAIDALAMSTQAVIDALGGGVKVTNAAMQDALAASLAAVRR
ncbi:hypothetical protein ALI22I_01475 [Saccharothrix sp. ALI-22-I]|uniref:WXG100 family type VII secretion target n=1 Tax=Saccharothrix sp. ALI-22-I TaxID=1933778 RepID=UPI00097C249C|nr:WXG100 family type VII secretion target [Saccharothrix sp. ALI-22-I]ONI92875.1 hypothetical protein ALI22I_01475 [Saccharothrix sp. ALI-22-I]